MQEQETTRPAKKLFTIREFVQAGYYQNEGGLRALIFRAERNGFKKVIKRINRKILLDVDAFYQWVEDINGNRGV